MIAGPCSWIKSVKTWNFKLILNVQILRSIIAPNKSYSQVIIFCMLFRNWPEVTMRNDIANLQSVLQFLFYCRSVYILPCLLLLLHFIEVLCDGYYVYCFYFILLKVCVMLTMFIASTSFYCRLVWWLLCLLLLLHFIVGLCDGYYVYCFYFILF